MIEERHRWWKRSLQGGLVTLEEVHDDSPHNDWDGAKSICFRYYFRFLETHCHAFHDSRKQVKAELLINCISLAPDEVGTDDSSHECKSIVFFPKRLSKKTLNHFINKDETAEISAMNPRKFDWSLQLFKSSAVSEQILHDNRMGHSYFTTVVETISCTSDGCDYALLQALHFLCLRHYLLFIAGISIVFQNLQLIIYHK